MMSQCSLSKHSRSCHQPLSSKVAAKAKRQGLSTVREIPKPQRSQIALIITEISPSFRTVARKKAKSNLPLLALLSGKVGGLAGENSSRILY